MGRRDLLLARARLLSSARRSKHGAMPSDAGEWWKQIEALAAELGEPITWDEWHSVSLLRGEPEQEEMPL
jgi:RecA-family ATPase